MTGPTTPKEVVELMKNEKVEIVDLRFMDFPGLWQHFSVPPREIEEDTFEAGLGFDGSSIRGWQAINESDMLVKPVAETAFIDPFFAAKTLVMICNICDPVTGEDYTRDPRNIARKAANYLKASLAVTSLPEVENTSTARVSLPSLVMNAFSSSNSVFSAELQLFRKNANMIRLP